ILVIGSGAAGLTAALNLAQRFKVTVLAKGGFAEGSTAWAQGGIAASLGNNTPDHWSWHMFDTVKGSDWLGDQDAIEYMVREAPQAVYELEHAG
ncbi:FAD-dependent oxidoreductase, partial [Escherichia coli]|uniref:FAD-dependent oxidoreductase n=1 Tax=Escherichia coli TaxID=562 RepID=UPI001953F99D